MTKQQIQILIKSIEIVNEIHQLSYKYLEGRVLPKTQQGLVTFTLFMRIDELFRSIILLASRDQPTGNYILIRTLSEAFALLKGVCSDEKFQFEYFNKNIKNKAKSVRSIIADGEKSKVNISFKELQELRDELEVSTFEGHPTLADAKQLFERFFLNELYHKTFAFCSLYVHTDSSTLDKFVTIEDGKLDVHTNKEIFKDSVLTLSMASSLYLKSFELITEYLKIENQALKNQLADLYNSFQEIIEAELTAQKIK